VRTSATGIRLGPVARFPVVGYDSEYPVLAMNASGRYLVAYPEDDPFGPFGVVIGSTASARIPAARAVRIGTRSDVSPIAPAVAADGEAVLGWSVRSQLHPAQNVIFGLGLGELAPGLGARWVYRSVLSPTASYDPGDTPSGTGVAFGSQDRVLEVWVTRTGSMTGLEYARQTTADGPLDARLAQIHRVVASVLSEPEA